MTEKPRISERPRLAARTVFLAALCAGALNCWPAKAADLPLEPGLYFSVEEKCGSVLQSAILLYQGDMLNSAAAVRKIVAVAKTGADYRLTMRVAGKPASSVTWLLRIAGRKRFSVKSSDGGPRYNGDYRWCDGPP